MANKLSVRETAPLHCRRPDRGGVHNVYVAGPLTGDGSREARDRNTLIACAVGDVIKRMGHRVHVPHAATAPFNGVWTRADFMDLDLSVITLWATAMYCCPGVSSGVDDEERRAIATGCRVWYCYGAVPRADRSALGPGCVSDRGLADILLGVAGGLDRVIHLFGATRRGVDTLRGALGLPEKVHRVWRHD